MTFNKKYNLPPMDLLLCFEAVSRHGSFTLAAEELCLTQSAVSKKISALETQLSTKLFERMHRAIRLTEDGRKILHQVEASLLQLNEGLKPYFPQPDQKRITVSASVSFAYFWLIPKLEKFYNLYPDIEVNVISSDTPVDLKKDGSDIAILFGDGEWPDMQSDQLVQEVIYVVASPAYMDRYDKISPANLSDHTLIHLKGGVQIHDGVNWDKWMHAYQVAHKPLRQGPAFNSYPLVLQAVEAGRGLGLGWDYAIQEKIDKGQLCRVFEEPLKTSNGYYLVSSSQADLSRPTRQFKEWIISEAKI